VSGTKSAVDGVMSQIVGKYVCFSTLNMTDIYKPDLPNPAVFEDPKWVDGFVKFISA